MPYFLALNILVSIFESDWRYENILNIIEIIKKKVIGILKSA